MTQTQALPDIDVSDLRRYAQDILDSLQCAEDCETASDLLANLDEALATAKLIQKDLKVMIDEVKEELGE